MAALDLLLTAASWLLLMAGGLFCFIGALGLNRMPDVFTRMHATSVSDTLGVGFLTLGMMLQTDDWTVLIRLGIIVIVLYTTGAVASHALARAALHDGQQPLLTGSDGKITPTACGAVFPELAYRVAAPLQSEVVDTTPPDTAPGTDTKEDPPSNS